VARTVFVIHGAGEPRRRRGKVYWEPPPDFGARLADLSPIYLYHSRDDTEVPFEHLERYRRALPHATVRVLDDRCHEFNQAQFPELAADIRGLALRRTV
jgi:pimeloyl-ACP methyl ester carboxylesterase